MKQEFQLSFDDFDKLNLKPFAENLFKNITKGIESHIGEEGAYTISLEAEFGNGKTTFLKMFKHFVENEKKDENYKVLFINAWKSDFYKEPVIAILYEFVDLIKTTQITEDAKENITNKIAEVIGKIAHHKMTQLTGNIANQLIAKRWGINIKEILNSVFNKKDSQKSNQGLIIKGQNILEELNQIKSAVKEIKDIILKYTKNKKLLIIVDELDRTRPDYAVHFLEDIKHFFDIKSVAFIVGVNRQQMKATVKCLYGQELNFEGYYRKFFKQEIDLPNPYKEVQRLIDELLKETKVKYSDKLKDRSFRVEDSYLSCKTFALTLREIENFVRIFDFILGNKTQIANWVYKNCYSFFICLFLKEKEVFNEILKGAFTVEQFIQFISKKGFDYKNYEDEADESKRKEKHDLNYLLGQVATSFIDSKESLERERTKIESEFRTITNVNRLFEFEDPRLGTIKGFTLERGQPALEICQNIKQYKSPFNE